MSTCAVAGAAAAPAVAAAVPSHVQVATQPADKTGAGFAANPSPMRRLLGAPPQEALADRSPFGAGDAAPPLLRQGARATIAAAPANPPADREARTAPGREGIAPDDDGAGDLNTVHHDSDLRVDNELNNDFPTARSAGSGSWRPTAARTAAPRG